MKKSYVMIYNDLTGTRDQIKQWADSSKLVLTWRFDLPHCFYLISENTASELSADLKAKTGKLGRYLIMEVSDNKQGWLPTETWYFLRHKKAKPKTE